METLNVKSRILMEMERLIARSSAKGKMTKKIQSFHEAIIQKHYNASDVSIDYHRQRVKMNLVMDEDGYDPKTINVDLAVLPMNLFFKNLRDFLKSCLEVDAKSIAFYAKLIQNLSNKDRIHVAV
ncbi:MAG: hypothetical protein AAGC45_03015 [Bacteroidota bacterium]